MPVERRSLASPFHVPRLELNSRQRQGPPLVDAGCLTGGSHLGRFVLGL